MTSMTVTATQSLDDRLVLGVYVVTGAATTQNGATVSYHSTAGGSTTITPNASSSLIFSSGYYQTDGNSRPAVGDTNKLFDDVTGPGATMAACVFMDSIHTTTAGTPVTMGCTNSSGFTVNLALAEILANGTLAIDSSTPAVAGLASTTATSRTTSSFDPPGGALLVALIWRRISNAVTVSDSQSLTWTRLVTSAGSFGFDGDVYVAKVPVPPSTFGTTDVGGHEIGGSVGTGQAPYSTVGGRQLGI